MSTSEQAQGSVPWPTTDGDNKQPAQEEYLEPLPVDNIARVNDSDITPDSAATRKEKRKTSYLAERRLSTWSLVALSISMLGVQMSWTVELAYGTPYLLGLGVSDQATSLVWLAGPLSGLIAQPLAGALSDASTSRFRRRSWVIGSTVVLVLTGLMLAFAKNLAAVILSMLGHNAPDDRQVSDVAIPIAIVAFYLFDFAINGVQASLRNLLLDITPQDQLSIANAWQGRMLHAGSIIGNGLGFYDLSTLPFLQIFGGNQFRKFCLLALLVLVVTVTITCVTQDEKQGSPKFGRNKNNILEAVSNISNAVLQLPRPVRRVCYVQIFSWIGWFPFLFYSTAYVGQVMSQQIGKDPDQDVATRAGEFALFLQALVAVTSGTIIPYLASRDQRLLDQDDSDRDEETERIRDMVRTWKAEAARDGRPLRLPTMPFMLRNIWTASLVMFALLMLSTTFITSVTMASVMITLCGVCWAVTAWVPFAILMEFLKEIDTGAVVQASVRVPGDQSRPLHARALSTPTLAYRGQRRASDERAERAPLLRRHSLVAESDLPLADDLSQSKKPLAGGTVLGIHNLAIVVPQFVVSIISSIIFKIANRHADPDNIYYGKTGVGWVLRFGGICALLAAVISRMVPPTKTEKEMRRRHAEIEFLKEDDMP